MEPMASFMFNSKSKFPCTLNPKFRFPRKLQLKVNTYELVLTSNAALSLVIRSIVVKNVIKLLIRMRNACLAWVGSPLKKVATF